VREVTDTTTIGRYDGNDLYLPDGGIAWRHAAVQRTDGGFELAVLPDAGQPVWVGSAPVAPGTSRLLQSGDQLRIGEVVVEFVGR
jgi:predicted component of type VI protein secretion system